jgi:hypothetical protein
VSRWKTARVLVEIPYFHEHNLDEMLKDEVHKAINIRFGNPRNYPKLRHRFGKIRFKLLAKVLESMKNTGVVMMELSDDITLSPLDSD